MTVESLDIDDGGAQYLPFAQNMLRRLKEVLCATGVESGRRHYTTPDGEGRILVRTRRDSPPNVDNSAQGRLTPDSDGWQDYIKVEIPKDPLGFFMGWEPAVAPHTFWAHYVDAVVEEIKAPGVPRVTTTPTPRTRGLKLPDSLFTREPAQYKLGSLYSGQMRRVVQCQLIKGIEPKFAYGSNKTHGILEYPYPRQVGATPAEESAAYRERRFWVTEISTQGVFAAPLTFGRTCKDCAANINDYLPTAEQIEATPAWAVHRAELSLAWAFDNRNAGNKVKRLLTSGEVAQLYAYGDPWYPAMGFAFSYSGREAANIVVNAVTDGFDFSAVDDYYETRLVTVSFEVTLDSSGEAILTAAANVGAAGQVTFKRSSFGTLWVPGSDINTWDGVYPFINTLNVSGPVHVFYDGEEQIVTQWGRSEISVAANRNINFTSVDAGWDADDWDGSATGAHVYGAAIIDLPVVQEADCFLTYTAVALGSGQDNSAYTIENYGFSGPFDLRLDSYSRSTKESATSWSGGEYVVSDATFGNTYSLCGGGTANCTINQVTYDRDALKTREDLSQAQSGTSVIMLLPQDREAVGGFKVTNYTATGTRSFVASKHRVRITETKVGGTGAFTDISRDSGAWRGGNTVPPSEPVSISTSSGTFYLTGSGGVRISQAVPNINLSSDLSPFLVYDVGSKETANSGLTYMRGGLFYSDPSLTPANQALNHRLKVDDTNALVVGFADLAGKINVGFVGQV